MPVHNPQSSIEIPVDSLDEPVTLIIVSGRFRKIEQQNTHVFSLVSTFSRKGINQVWLPILLVVT